MKTLTKLKRTRKAFSIFINQTIKNFKCMKKKLKSIWLMTLFITCLISTELALQGCNVTRVVTNESRYFQRGDTTVTITTKTTESYDASKKGAVK